MDDERDTEMLVGAAALEHQTGRSRGTVTWLSGSTLYVSLSSNRLIRVSNLRPDEPRDDFIACFHRVEDSYEIEDLKGQAIWVNGVTITTQRLVHGDMIEFGETGPLSRFRHYREGQPLHKTVGEMLSDSLTYLRVSRQPIIKRVFRAVYGILRRLMRETTGLFRVGIILSIAALAALAYQQNRVSVLLQQQIETSATRLDSFAGALTRARNEALTPKDLKVLRQEFGQRLISNAERLAALEQRSKANARVITESAPSVLFLQGAYGFRERSSGRMLRHIVDEDRRLLISPTGQPLLSLEGDGPVAERQFTGTGFIVGDGGALVTNRHVALPWENDANIEALKSQAIEPIMIKFIAYMPGKATSSIVEFVRASAVADLAVLRLKDVAEVIRGLKLADAPPALGDEVIVMGYPTGLRSILAQSGDAFVEELQKAGDTEFWSVGARLAEKGFVAPLSSRGIVGQATRETIIYDAETTGGGSGGPVLNINGLVVAVNAATLPEYGGSNLGVPIAKVRALLEEVGLR
ncbi:MAG: trypsin-like peptidase domain-containing protein [Rhodospirillales bacterium]|nr:trypsin-like peptidase domain-containing protein [Rhodospirillales bacterium]